MIIRTIFLVSAGTAALGLLLGCATTKSAVRQLASRDLGCPDDEIRINRDEDGIYYATGCGNTIRVTCHDPYVSTGGTGANWGVADPATAGNRVKCDRLLDAPASTTMKPANTAMATGTTTVTSAPARGRAEFDRALAAKLLGAAADRAQSCGAPGGPTGSGRAHVTFGTDGTIASVTLEPPFADNEVGRCVVREIQRVSLPAFTGDSVLVAKTFEVR
jgi:hypothetical protein